MYKREIEEWIAKVTGDFPKLRKPDKAEKLPEKYGIVSMIHELIVLGYGNEEYVKNNCTVKTFYLAMALENRKYDRD